MAQKKIINLKRYSSISRLSGNTTSNLSADSNAFNTDDPLFYTRMGKERNSGIFRRSLNPNNTAESSTILDSGSMLTTDSPPKNWYKDLDKYEKSMRFSSENQNPRHATIEENVSKDSIMSSDSEKLPPRRKKIDLRNALKHDDHGSTPLKKALEDESSSSEVVAVSQNRKRKSVSKKTNISEHFDSQKSNEAEKSLRMQENVSKESAIGSDSDESPPRRKKIDLRNVVKHDARGSTPLKKALEDEPSSTEVVAVNQSRKRKSLSKNSFNKTNISENSEKSSDTEKFLKARKPRNFFKIRNIQRKSTENAFRKFFDEENSESESDISDKNKNQHSQAGASNKLNTSRNSSRLNKSVEPEKQISKRLSSFIDAPQYESTRKIDVKQMRQSPRNQEIRKSRLSNIKAIDEDLEISQKHASKAEEQREKMESRRSAHKISKIPYRDASDEEEDYNLQISNPTINVSSKAGASIHKSSKISGKNVSDEERESDYNLQISNPTANVSSKAGKSIHKTSKISDKNASDEKEESNYNQISNSTTNRSSKNRTSTHKISKIPDKDASDEEEESDYNIQISNPTMNSSKTRSIQKISKIGDRDASDEEEESDSNIQISNPAINRSKTRSIQKISDKNASDEEEDSNIQISNPSVNMSKTRPIQRISFRNASDEEEKSNSNIQISNPAINRSKTRSIQKISDKNASDEEENSNIQISNPAVNMSKTRPIQRISFRNASDEEEKSNSNIQISNSNNNSSKRRSIQKISDRNTSDEEEESDSNIQISNPNNNSSKTRSIQKISKIPDKVASDEEEFDDNQISNPTNNSSLKARTSLHQFSKIPHRDATDEEDDYNIQISNSTISRSSKTRTSTHKISKILDKVASDEEEFDDNQISNPTNNSTLKARTSIHQFSKIPPRDASDEEDDYNIQMSNSTTSRSSKTRTSTHKISKISDRVASNEEEESDYNIQMSHPTINSSKTRSIQKNSNISNRDASNEEEESDYNIRLSNDSSKARSIQKISKNPRDASDEEEFDDNQISNPTNNSSLKARTSIHQFSKIAHRDASDEDYNQISDLAINRSSKTKSIQKNSRIRNRDFSDEEEESDYNIQISNPTVNISSKNSKFSAGEKTIEADVHKSKRVDKMDFESGNQNQSSENIRNTSFQARGNHSERSLTVSLSEGDSNGNKTISDETVNEFTNTSSQRLSTNLNKSYENNLKNDKEAKMQNQIHKPEIRKVEILQANDINLKKFKENYNLQSQNENDRNFDNSSQLSKFSKSPKSYLKRPNVSTIEEEFSRIHGIEDEQVPSTSNDRTQISRNQLENLNSTSKSITQQNSSLKDLRKTLESDESDYSESPLMTYCQNNQEDDHEEENRKNQNVSKGNKSKNSLSSTINRSKKQEFQKSQENKQMQTTIHDFIKPSARKKVSPVKKSVNYGDLMSVSEVFDNKKNKDEFLERIKESAVQAQKEIDSKKKVTKPVKKFMKPIQNNVKKPPKSVHPAFLFNGKVYKQPKLPRPMPWASDKLYNYITKKIEPKFGIKTRVQSGKIVSYLSEVVMRVLRLKLFKNYEKDINNLKKFMAEMGIIVTQRDFIDFSNEFLPIAFREKAVPMLILGTNKVNIPFDISTLDIPIDF